MKAERSSASVLFVYTTQDNIGLGGKAKTIVKGFRDTGGTVDTFILNDSVGFWVKLRDLMRFNASIIKALVVKNYDVIFVRYAYYLLPVYLACWILRRPVQIELNGNVAQEQASAGRHGRAVIERVVLAVAMKSAYRVHVVSMDLVDLYGPLYPHARLVFTPNFVVDETYLPLVPTAIVGPVRLVFLGNTSQGWHGVEEFLDVVVKNSVWFRENCELHIVGECTVAISNFIATNQLERVVFKYGFLSGDAKHRAIASMHIGICGFRLDRKGLLQTTAIKNGEYLYAGLGLILGYEDPVIVSSLPFVLKIDIRKAEEARLKVQKFIDVFRLNPAFRAQAHEFARSHLLVDRYIANIVG